MKGMGIMYVSEGGSALASPNTARVNYVKAAFAAAMFFWGIAGVRDYSAFMFIHGVDLLIHEFGHPFFSLLGDDVVTALGGTLMQLLCMPLVFTGYFVTQGQLYAASITLWWVGQSIADVAVYLRDAPIQALPLIGGGNVTHDWNFLLGHWGLLRQADPIADSLVTLAVLMFVCSLLGGLYFSQEP